MLQSFVNICGLCEDMTRCISAFTNDKDLQSISKRVQGKDIYRTKFQIHNLLTFQCIIDGVPNTSHLEIPANILVDVALDLKHG